MIASASRLFASSLLLSDGGTDMLSPSLIII